VLAALDLFALLLLNLLLLLCLKLFCFGKRGRRECNQK